MGRNLNALLNSAVKARREQSAERSGDATDAAPSTVTAHGQVADDRAADGRADDVATLVLPRPPFERPSAPPLLVGREFAPTDVDVGTDADVVAGGTDPGADAVRADVAFASPVPDAPREPNADGRTAPDEPRIARVVQIDDLPHAPGDPPRPGDRLRMIGVERIRRGVFQPRRFFDQEALQELADSLQAQGMIQPVIVRPFGGAFELVAGERRWRAAQIAGLAEIPAIVREMEDRTVAAVSLIENIQRENLNPLEEAQALTRLCDEFGMTHASVAESIGRSRASVSNLMRLLELHDDVKVLVDKGELDMGHARALLRVPKVDQPALAARVAKQGLTVRAVEKLIRTGMDKRASAPPADVVDPDVERLAERLSGVLGAPVSIRHKPGGSGRLEIGYSSLEELDGILAHIK